MTNALPLSDARKQQLVTVLQTDPCFRRDSAHDLRKTLRAIKGDSELLTESQIDEILTLARPANTSKPRTALRSITQQGISERKPPKGKFERRWIGSKYPGCWIDKNHNVGRHDGNEAVKSIDKRGWACARLKNADGEWKNPAVNHLLELAGFRESWAEKKARMKPEPSAGGPNGYNDYAEAHAEDPEAYPDEETYKRWKRGQ